MSWKIFVIVLQLMVVAVCTGMYLTAASYFMKEFKSSVVEYGRSMRFLLGIIFLEMIAIALLGK